MPEQFKAMMADKEIQIIEGILKPNFECLEFGSGYSTAYFPQFVSRWVAMEHDFNWVVKVASMKSFNQKHNTQILTASEINYIDRALAVNKKFDFILIDGIRRKECLDASFEMLKPNGVILLHDSSRFEYADWINNYPGEVLCDGEMPDENNLGYYLIRGLKKYEL